jgi:hypothetical protein
MVEIQRRVILSNAKDLLSSVPSTISGEKGKQVLRVAQDDAASIVCCISRYSRLNGAVSAGLKPGASTRCEIAAESRESVVNNPDVA